MVPVGNRLQTRFWLDESTDLREQFSRLFLLSTKREGLVEDFCSIERKQY